LIGKMQEPKEKVKVIVYTSIGNIRGSLHKLVGGRLLDLVNFSQKDFIALTNVEILDQKTGQVFEKTPFFAVHRDNIIGIREDK